MKSQSFFCGVAAAFFSFFPVNATEVSSPGPQPSHGISIHGDLKYADPQKFTHFFSYQPDAPKGGTLRLAAIGRVFDTLNPFLPKGICPMGLGLYHFLPFDALMERAPDEPFSLYGRLAETAEMPEDRSWIIFNLRPQAHFNDQEKTPVTAEDVAFTFEMLKKYGSPARKVMGEKIRSIEILSPHRIKFSFKPNDGVYDRELPLVMAMMVVLSKKSLIHQTFDKTGMTPLIGSGPYTISHVNPGKSITYQRVKDYWGKDLPVVQGLYNPDQIIYEYFGTELVAFEAFKKGEIDFWLETDLNRWKMGYNFQAVHQADVIKKEVPHAHPVGLTAFVFNTRRPFFENIWVRQALALLFDFEWLNKNLFHQAYVRTHSFFENTEFAASGLPSPQEKEILDQLPRVAPDLYGPLPIVSRTDGSGLLRKEKAAAYALLTKAGWVVKNNKVVHEQTGQPFSFTILISDPKRQRIAAAFARNLEEMGLSVTVSTVDGAEYQNRLQNHQFDMIIHTWGHSLSPGIEQQLYWSSAMAHVISRNYAGVGDPSVDALCNRIVQSRTRQDLVLNVKVLDRVLRHGHYVIPLFHKTKETIAYWKHLGHPVWNETGLPNIYSWWVHSLERIGPEKR